MYGVDQLITLLAFCSKTKLALKARQCEFKNEFCAAVYLWNSKFSACIIDRFSPCYVGNLLKLKLLYV